MSNFQDAKRFRFILKSAFDERLSLAMESLVEKAQEKLIRETGIVTDAQEVEAFITAIEQLIGEEKFEADRPKTVEMPVEPTWTMLEQMEGVYGQQDSPEWYDEKAKKYKRLIKEGAIK